MLKFNPDKTQCIRFSWKLSGGCSSVFMFCGKYIECVKSVLHLGHVLTENLQDDLDIQRCRSDFIKRANCVLHRFAFVISGCHSIYNTCYKRFYKMLCLAKSSCNYLLHSIFHASSLSCRSFVGYNSKFGSSFVRDYSRVDFSLVRLIKEIRDRYIYVPGFDHFSPNCMAHATSRY